MAGMDIDLLEMGKIPGEHLNQGEPDGSIASERHPKPTGHLSLQKVSLARNFL